MPEVEIWYNAMQSISLTVKKAELYIRNFQNSVARIRNSVVTNHESVNLSAAAKEVCDSVRLMSQKDLNFLATYAFRNYLMKKSFLCIYLDFH